ncbi:MULTISPECIES: acyl carrier protein [unclassified Streptomyces]|uniref:acyl carrier protein n=1 Tax=unclassified Streptomyces TaxID=2593676 RepID=UPI001587EDBE|nr:MULTISPECIES: acyl carrier protein [unclassified Streptomyces]NUV67898.1 acyl carrier protein [Streptomyces sp. CAI-121]NUW01740.1 acyl carrier protein [Streptomyces sp. CAI 127]NUW14544.1 acyl carrier protein [Streptomyces sp. CAI-68]
MSNDLRSTIHDILVDDLEVDTESIATDVRLDTLELDSLAIVEFITRVKEEFNVDLADEESALKNKTFGELVELVDARLGSS